MENVINYFKSNILKKVKLDEEAEQKKELQLIDLHTECLMKICAFLTYKDLLSLRKTHRHFHKAIDYILIANSKKQNKAPKLIVCLEDIQLIKEYLSIVGKEMKYLNVETERALCNQNIAPILQSIMAENCNAGNIKYCSLRSCFITQQYVEEYQNFFDGLIVLELKCCLILDTELKWFLDYVARSRLEKFQVTNKQLNVPFNIFPIIAASNLETCIMNLRQPLNRKEYKTPMLTNSKLKTLNLGPYKYELAIIQHFPNIENFSYHLFDEQKLEAISGLLKLKRLVLTGNNLSSCIGCLSEIAKRNTLEVLVLHLSDFTFQNNIDELFAENLRKMTNLKELKLNLLVYDLRYLKGVGEHLTKLQILHIQVCITMSASDEVINTVLNFVKASKDLRFLHIKIPLPSQKHQKLYDEIVTVRRTAGYNEVLQLNLDHCEEEITAVADQKRFVCCNGKLFYIHNLLACLIVVY